MISFLDFFIIFQKSCVVHVLKDLYYGIHDYGPGFMGLAFHEPE